MFRDRCAHRDGQRSLGHCSTRRVDDDVAQQPVDAAHFRGGFRYVRRQLSLSDLQSHRRRQEIREKIRGGFADVENGISARRGKFCSHFAGAVFGFLAGKIFRQIFFPKTAGAATRRPSSVIIILFCGHVSRRWPEINCAGSDEEIARAAAPAVFGKKIWRKILPARKPKTAPAK